MLYTYNFAYFSVCVPCFSCLKKQLIDYSLALDILNRHALSLHWSTNPTELAPPSLPPHLPLLSHLFTQRLLFSSQASHKPTAGPLNWLYFCLDCSPHGYPVSDFSPPSHFHSNPKTDKLQPMVKLSLLPISVNEVVWDQPPLLFYRMLRAGFIPKSCWAVGQQSLEYVLSGLLQKRFSNPYSAATFPDLI